MTGPGGPSSPGGPSDPRGPCHPLRKIPGREMLNWSGRAGELGGPARAGPISTSLGVSPCTAAEGDDWPGEGRVAREGRVIH